MPSDQEKTSGGCVMFGQHCINTWAKTQSLIAKSSAESELYGIVKASCEALGTLTLVEELGKELKARKSARRCGRGKRNRRASRAR